MHILCQPLGYWLNESTRRGFEIQPVKYCLTKWGNMLNKYLDMWWSSTGNIKWGWGVSEDRKTVLTEGDSSWLLTVFKSMWIVCLTVSCLSSGSIILKYISHHSTEIQYILNFLVVTLKKVRRSKTKFSNVFLTQYYQNIISTCDQYKKYWSDILLFFQVSETCGAFYTYTTSQLGLVRF